MGGEYNMKNKMVKTLSLCMACLTLTLLLNVVIQKNNSKTALITQVLTNSSTDQDGPWG